VSQSQLTARSAPVAERDVAHPGGFEAAMVVALAGEEGDRDALFEGKVQKSGGQPDSAKEENPLHLDHGEAGQRLVKMFDKHLAAGTAGLSALGCYN